MSFATARLATEKADFRPALLLHSFAGFLPEKTMSEYSEKLKDPRWQKMRLEILNRDNWHCQICMAGEFTLHVHHRRYLRGKLPWEYPQHMLVTLCEYCHAEETEVMADKIAELIDCLKDAGIFSHQVQRIIDAFKRGAQDGVPATFVEPDWSEIEDLIVKISESRWEA